MELELKRVSSKNIWDLVKLEVKDEQTGFVAANTVSLLEAYMATAEGGCALPFGIYTKDIPVGFLMIGYDCTDWEDAPRIAEKNYVLWRLMIDKRYQGQGYGKQAVALALDYIQTMPCGAAEYCWLSYEPENTAAKELYHCFGFKETGELDGEEVIAALKLNQKKA